MSFYWLWLKRMLFSPKKFFQSNVLFSLSGLILAVAVLTVALMVVNGFSSGLEKVLIDKQGHIRVHSSSGVSKEELFQDIAPYRDSFSAQAVFLSFEGLIVKDSDFKGVFFEAVQDEKLKENSFLKGRILKGGLESPEPFLIIGKDLAEKLKLSVGSLVSLIVSVEEDSYFSKKQAHLKLGAIADFGRYEFNSSFVLMPLSSAEFLDFDHISGLSIWIKNKEETDLLHQQLFNSLKGDYSVQSWKDRDRAFLEVIESDKKIIFFVLLILVIVAGFNISSSLFVQVFRKTKDISILKAMGAKKSLIRNLFLLNGLILGFFGSIIGILIGLLICYALVFIQNKWNLIPASVYQVNEILWNWKSGDLFLIFIVSLLIVVFSSLLPARRAYKMSVKMGLSYD